MAAQNEVAIAMRSTSYTAATEADRVPTPGETTVFIDNDTEASESDPSFTPQRRSHVQALDRSEMALTWCDIKYTIPVKMGKKEGKVDKVILNKLTGSVKPGEMLCVMGTSGSGKTSFINLLAGRYSVGTVQGDVLCNGIRRNNEYKRSIGYVEQDDLMFARLTVEEMLRYTAILRLPSTLSRERKVARAKEVLEQLGLTDCRNTRIGAADYRGISGGERKRTSIGIELITNPRILFLDEPTSGLDAYTAVHVMETIKRLTNTGRAVVCSIHQPREKIFKLFDKLLLLAKGETCYFGPVTSARDFFASTGYPCPADDNLADYILDVTTIDPRTPKLLEETSAMVANIKQCYSQSEYFTAATKSTAAPKGTNSDSILSNLRSINSGRQWPLPYFEEFGILLSRAWKLVMREPRATKASVFRAVFMALLTGIVFFDLGNDQTGIRDREGVLFFLVLGNAFPALQNCVLLFHTEKQVFNRERQGGAYRVSTYFTSKSIADMPITVAPMFLNIIICYWMIGLVSNAEVFFKTTLMLIMVIITSQSFGMLISTVAPTVQIAQLMAPLSMILLLLFGGFYLSINSIPIWLKWIEIFSFLQYGFVGLCRIQFEGQKFSCDSATYCQPDGEAVLKEMGIDGDDRTYWAEFGKLSSLAVGFRIAAYFGLRFLNRKKLRFN